jgi:hypothetical protein
MSQQKISESTPTMYKEELHYVQISIIPGMQDWAYIQKSFNIIHYNKKLKRKHINVSTDDENYLTNSSTQSW